MFVAGLLKHRRVTSGIDGALHLARESVSQRTDSRLETAKRIGTELRLHEIEG